MSRIGDLYGKEQRKREELKRQREKEAKARQLAEKKRKEEEQRLQAERGREFERIEKEHRQSATRLTQESGLWDMLNELKRKHGIKVVDMGRWSSSGEGFYHDESWKSWVKRLAVGKVIKSEYVSEWDYYEGLGETAGIHSVRRETPERYEKTVLCGVMVEVDGTEDSVTIDGCYDSLKFTKEDGWSGLAEALAEELTEGIARKHTVWDFGMGKKILGIF